ncbi:MAG: hypothetical protein FJ087_10865 [Deltaproteobacteria bacterium]|nr:hypothetical protein [Deltaproteobacteria bacterium]
MRLSPILVVLVPVCAASTLAPPERGCGAWGTAPPAQPPIPFAGAGPPDDTCARITWEGCCDGDAVRWCDRGVERVLDCGGQSPACGWDHDAGRYDCGGRSPACGWDHDAGR